MIVFLFVYILSSTSLTSAVQLIQGPINQTVKRGQTATLECSVSSIRPGEAVVWRRNDGVGEENKTYISANRYLFITDPKLRPKFKVIWTKKDRDFHLQISDFQDIDAGTYDCGYTDSRHVFTKLAAATLSIDIPSPGSPTCTVFPVKPNIGDSVTLTCSAAAGAFPAPNLSWEVNGRQISTNVGQSILTIDRMLQKADEGVIFRCKADSKQYPKGPSCVITPLPGRPVATVRADKPFYEEGDNATFTCSEQSRKSVKFSWTKVDVNILMTKRFELKKNNRLLIVMNLSKSDNNSIVECKVETADNRISVGASMTIQMRDMGGPIGTSGPTVLAPLVEKNPLHPAAIVVFVLLVIAIVVILALILIRYSRRKSQRSSHSKM